MAFGLLVINGFSLDICYETMTATIKLNDGVADLRIEIDFGADDDNMCDLIAIAIFRANANNDWTNTGLTPSW